MNFDYQIYGLRLSINVKISLMESAVNAGNDLTVTIAAGNGLFPETEWERIQSADLDKRKNITLYRSVNPSSVFLKTEYRTPEGPISFVLSPDKRDLWINHDPNVSSSNLESYLVGPILGVILRLRGVLCLHASVVEVAGKAVAFLGNKRSGKSTTAATFARNGHRVLADDLGVIASKGNAFYVQPGYSRLRLRKLTAEAIHPQLAERLPMVYTFGDSQYSKLDKNFCDNALQLVGIYILTPNNDSHSLITSVGLAESLALLGQNTFGNYAITSDTRKLEFETLVEIATTLPVRRLNIVYDIANIDGQYQAVINDFHEYNAGRN